MYLMNKSIEIIQKTFFRQALTCLKTSPLYHDMLKIFGNKKEVAALIYEIITRRNMTGIIESTLTFLAFFHFHTLKNTEGFSELKKFYKTQGGNYRPDDYASLENILANLWQNNKKQIKAWMMATKLQTNEIGRCSAIFPSILSLGLEKINLIDLGCSAGLMLLMNLYSYEYFNQEDVFTIYQYKPLLLCKTPNPAKIQSLFENKIEIVKKIGLDLFPVDLNDDENALMLKATLWDDTVRCKRLEQAIELFRKHSPPDISLLPLDYTLDLIKPLESLIDKNCDLVFYCSVSTYQIPLESYHRLINRLKELAEHLHKKIYFIEFEELKKDQVKNVTPEEPFHITIHTFPEEVSYEFGRAHFHGNALTVF